jgi:hypothetical protein
LPAGSRIATTEVGYLGFERLDLNILDMRGLNDMAIARSVAGVWRTYVGDMDPYWVAPTDPVGRVLERFAPDVIITNDGLMTKYALGGTYRLLRTFGPSSILPFGIYIRTFTYPPSCLLRPLPY